MDETEKLARENVDRLAAEYAAENDATGWFDALYKEANGNISHIPWADLEPNKYFKAWAEKTALKGSGRRALVVGCGLGDDAVYLDSLGFQVTAFDISPTAIEWAKRMHSDKAINFVAADLFASPDEWIGAFEFVLEIHTIQPLPLNLRPKVIDAIASFVATDGELVAAGRLRENDAPVGDSPPWPVSRADLSRFEINGLEQIEFNEMWDEEDNQTRFVVKYSK